MSIKRPNCPCLKQNKKDKVYIFKNECQRFRFCESCVAEKNLSSFLLKVVGENDYYSCCRNKPQGVYYRLFTLSDALIWSDHSPVACSGCRSIKIGDIQLENTDSFKMCDYNKKHLCLYSDIKESDVYCFKWASYNLESIIPNNTAALPRCFVHRGIFWISYFCYHIFVFNFFQSFSRI
jgi:hypothetical protein